MIRVWGVLAFVGPAVWAQSTTEFTSVGEHVVLTPHMGWYIEGDEPLAYDEALAKYAAGEFEEATSEWLELGLMDATVWLAATIRNATNSSNLVIEFRNPRMTYVDLYVPDGEGGCVVLENGAARAYSARDIRHPMPAFPLTIAPGETQTVLLRLENLGDFRTRVWLWNAEAFYNRVSHAYYPEMLTIGFLLVLALFHFLVFVSLREPAYLHLSLFIASYTLFYMAGNGTGHALLWQDFTWLSLRCNSMFFVTMSTTFMLFTMSYLETRKYTPALHKVAMVFVALCLAHLAYICFSDTLLRMRLNQWLGLATLTIIGALVVQSIRRGSRPARFFLLSWIFVIAASGLMLLTTMYLVSSQWMFGYPSVSLMFCVSILLWSFELTGRIKVRVQEQRRLLEEQVRERTRELETALKDVKTLSGLLPICSSCKKIRDDTGYWSTVETYVTKRTDADFTHGICPDCYSSLYPELAARKHVADDNAPG